MNETVRRTVVVEMENGLHLVPCSQIAQAARRYEGEVKIHNGEKSADAKNVLDLMTLRAEYGTRLELEASGGAAADVVETILRLFESRFERHENVSK